MFWIWETRLLWCDLNTVGFDVFLLELKTRVLHSELIYYLQENTMTDCLFFWLAGWLDRKRMMYGWGWAQRDGRLCKWHEKVQGLPQSSFSLWFSLHHSCFSSSPPVPHEWSCFSSTPAGLGEAWKLQTQTKHRQKHETCHVLAREPALGNTSLSLLSLLISVPLRHLQLIHSKSLVS